ncbi:hypothetical protein ACAH01_08905 [Halomicrobium sp. HM KBTZ05]|uniref:hypothetical protein n=1 Tax=Halomicrobium sp. HM KBTZ05 TaxID=3242663 RepID=UPI003555BE59
MSNSLVSVDRVRLSDLSPIGWFGIALAIGALGYAANDLLKTVVRGGPWVDPLAVAGVGLVFGFGVAYLDGGPEIESTCDHCGAYIRAQSSRGGVDEYIECHASATPRRATLGPLSVVLQRQTAEWTYCSGDCATADRDRRVAIDDARDDIGLTTEVADD